jgi:cytochrome bd-type quinol oxidase subunit 2
MLETIWFLLWGVLWAVYFALDGFDQIGRASCRERVYVLV